MHVISDILMETSDFFKILFDENLEGNQEKIELKDVETEDFIEFLNHIYSDEKKITKDNFYTLYTLADRFLTPLLFKKCCDFIKENPNMINDFDQRGNITKAALLTFLPLFRELKAEATKLLGYKLKYYKHDPRFMQEVENNNKQLLESEALEKFKKLLAIVEKEDKKDSVLVELARDVKYLVSQIEQMVVDNVWWSISLGKLNSAMARINEFAKLPKPVQNEPPRTSDRIKKIEKHKYQEEDSEKSEKSEKKAKKQQEMGKMNKIPFRTMYLGIISQSAAERSLKKGADFRIYHQADKYKKWNDLPTSIDAVKMYLVSKTDEGFRHDQIRQAFSPSGKKSFCMSRGEETMMFKTVEELVSYYQVQARNRAE